MFAESKDFGFKGQEQRASVSIMNNIAEGFKRKGNKEFKQFLFITFHASSQNITGTFRGIANQQIKLFGFNGFDTSVIDSIQANEKGGFKLSYGESDYGMGYFSTEENKPIKFALSRRNAVQ